MPPDVAITSHNTSPLFLAPVKCGSLVRDLASPAVLGADSVSSVSSPSLPDRLDAVLVQPTNSGKTFALVLPAIYLGKMCLLILPQVNLVQEKRTWLKLRGVCAVDLSSQIPLPARRDTLQAHAVAVLLAMPEVFAHNREVQEAVWDLARSGRLSHLAVDEAHNIHKARSTNFRTAAFYHLAECRDIGLHCRHPVQLATATASPACRLALVRTMRLDLRRTSFILGAISRGNLTLGNIFLLAGNGSGDMDAAPPGGAPGAQMEGPGGPHFRAHQGLEPGLGDQAAPRWPCGPGPLIGDARGSRQGSGCAPGRGRGRDLPGRLSRGIPAVHGRHFAALAPRRGPGARLHRRVVGGRGPQVSQPAAAVIVVVVSSIYVYSFAAAFALSSRWSCPAPSPCVANKRASPAATGKRLKCSLCTNAATLWATWPTFGRWSGRPGLGPLDARVLHLADGLQETRTVLEEELCEVAQVYRGVACTCTATAFFLEGWRRGNCGDVGEPGGAAEALCKFCVGVGMEFDLAALPREWVNQHLLAPLRDAVREVDTKATLTFPATVAQMCNPHRQAAGASPWRGLARRLHVFHELQLGAENLADLMSRLLIHLYACGCLSFEPLHAAANSPMVLRRVQPLQAERLLVR